MAKRLLSHLVCDADSQETKTVLLLHFSSTDVDRGVCLCLHFPKIKVLCVLCAAWTRGGRACSSGGLQCTMLEWRRCDNQSKMSNIQLQSMVLKPRVLCQFHRSDYVECWAEINQQHSDVGVVIFKMCKDWVEGSGDGILCGPVEDPGWLGCCLWCAEEPVSQSISSEWGVGVPQGGSHLD